MSLMVEEQDFASYGGKRVSAIPMMGRDLYHMVILHLSSAPHMVQIPFPPPSGTYFPTTISWKNYMCQMVEEKAFAPYGGESVSAIKMEGRDTTIWWYCTHLLPTTRCKSLLLIYLALTSLQPLGRINK